MAIFDFLNSSQNGTQNITTNIDPQIKQAYLSNLNFADTVASRPYQQYGGPRIAGFTPDQTQAFGQVRGMQGQYQPFINDASTGIRGVMAAQPSNITPGSFLNGNVQAYMNPYTSQVVDQSLQDINRQRQIAGQGVRANAVSSGAFGGTREAIALAENDRNYADQFARTSAQLRNQGFDTAANLLQTDLNRDFNAQQANQNNQLAFGTQKLNAANQLINTGQVAQNLGFADVNALNQVGQQQQQQVQKNYDLANQDFQNQFNYPVQQLQIRQSALGANIPDAGKTTTTPLYTNTAGNVLGAGIGLNQLFATKDNPNPIGSFLSGIGSSVGKTLSGYFGSIFD